MNYGAEWGKSMDKINQICFLDAQGDLDLGIPKQDAVTHLHRLWAAQEKEEELTILHKEYKKQIKIDFNK